MGKRERYAAFLRGDIQLSDIPQQQHPQKLKTKNLNPQSTKLNSITIDTLDDHDHDLNNIKINDHDAGVPKFASDAIKQPAQKTRVPKRQVIQKKTRTYKASSGGSHHVQSASQGLTVSQPASDDLTEAPCSDEKRPVPYEEKRNAINGLDIYRIVNTDPLFLMAQEWGLYPQALTNLCKQHGVAVVRASIESVQHASDVKNKAAYTYKVIKNGGPRVA